MPSSPSPSPSPAVSATPAPPRFPLRVSADRRYLVDAAGTPFLYNADTAWMLFLKLSRDDAREYLTARKRQGFTVVQLQLTGFYGAHNRAGEGPFLTEGDFSTPNERFFAHVDDVIGDAEALGLYLAVAPLWVGCCGEGWGGRGKPLQTNSREQCRAFGRWLGERYGSFPHLMWIMGGDNDPLDDREAIRQVALALKAAAPDQLITYHAASTHSSTDVWPPDEPWLDVSMTYTYFRGFNKAWNKSQPDVEEVNHAECHRQPTRPFFLGESTYEGEHGAWGSAWQARKQAYSSLLSGGMGHAYGSPNWNFPAHWRETLNLPGAQSLRHLRDLFTERTWWTLRPDEAHRLAVDGLGEPAANDSVVTARAADGSFALSYFPSPKAVTYELPDGPRPVAATWFDPTNGVRHPAEGSPWAAPGRVTLTPPAHNAAGDPDHVLILKWGK